MKRWDICFYLLLIAFCFWGMTGCSKDVSVQMDGIEMQVVCQEEKHWISVESLQNYGFALRMGKKVPETTERSWVLYPLPPDMQTMDRTEITVQEDCKDKVYCNGLQIPAKVINGEWMVALEDLTGEDLQPYYETYGGVQEKTEQLQTQRYGVYLVQKEMESEGEWQLRVLRPTMPLRTPWGCMLFEKALTDDIPFTKEQFSVSYVSLPDLAEEMDLPFVLHKGILHIHADEAAEVYQVPLEVIPEDFLEKRLLSGYILTGEGMRLACVYDGFTLYVDLEDLREVLSAEGYVYKEATRTFARNQ